MAPEVATGSRDEESHGANNSVLSLSEAADLLGVHPSTLRLWSDKGLVPSVRTAGGHRRYHRADVTLWAGTRHKPRQIEPERMIDEVIRSVRTQISEGRLGQEAWYQKLDNEARLQYRAGARSLFQGLITYLAWDGKEASSEAFAIGYEYASRGRRYRLSYVDATRAFLFFRDTLIESVIKVYSEAHVPAGQMATMFHKIHAFTDAILTSLLETYEKLEEARR